LFHESILQLARASFSLGSSTLSFSTFRRIQLPLLENNISKNSTKKRFFLFIPHLALKGESRPSSVLFLVLIGRSATDVISFPILFFLRVFHSMQCNATRIETFLQHIGVLWNRKKGKEDYKALYNSLYSTLLEGKWGDPKFVWRISDCFLLFILPSFIFSLLYYHKTPVCFLFHLWCGVLLLLFFPSHFFSFRYKASI
jgi:hypothetical protein